MTPLENIDGIYFKREDFNPSGSVKDRWLSLKIAPNQSYVISSSGNAAISAQHFSPNVTVFVSPKTNPHKLKLIKNYHLT
ncbi:MAG: pyridoxal-phosphate dependent enzyme, partial [Candidatus Shapirobacteria bacterium]|nr:pyridoxal-phosphate dependent enzyme [Candidatus Shapirobacteria bacterium]